MYYWLLFLAIWLLVFVISWFHIGDNHRSNLDYAFMSIPHTMTCRAIAATGVIISHIAGHRFFTPLGGIGVSIFLILSGYGVCESYKRKGLGGVLEKQI